MSNNPDAPYVHHSFLVADDDKYARKIVVQILTGLGCRRVIESEDGGQACVELRNWKPDLILCDLDMKPVGGLDLLRRIRSASTGADADTPVILITARGTPEIIKEAMVLGVDSVVAKPPSASVLRKKIDFVLSGRK